MKKIKIFNDRDLRIDLPTFVDSRALLCANSGGGKSYAIRKLLEESHGKVMALVLDVEGEFKTLREKFDFLLIGMNGDVPINMKSASLLPKKLLDLNVSTIVDISDLKRHERITYVKKFLEALMELPRKFWKPCLVVLDEAHLLCGQQEKQDSYAAVIDLMTRGRKRGYCGILCTQRVAKLHKDAVAEANNIMIGRTGLDIDMKRAAEILGFTSKKDMLSLRDLQPGEFYIFGTAISRHVTKARINAVVTTHPKVGMDLKAKMVQPTQKIKSMLSKLNDLPKEAEKELRTQTDMKKEINRLMSEKRKLEFDLKKKKPEIDPTQLKSYYEKGIKNGYNEGIKDSSKKINELLNKVKPFNMAFIKIARIISEFQAVKIPDTKKITEELRKAKRGDTILLDENRGIVKNITPSIPEPVTPLVKETESLEGFEEKKLSVCAKRVYSFLFANPDRGFTKIQLGCITGYSPNSGHFNNVLCNLNSRGLIRRENNLIYINESDPDLATAAKENFSIELWLNKLQKCSKEIFKFLLDNSYEEFTKEELGGHTNYSSESGHFNNCICELSALGVIIRSGSKLKLNPEMLEI